MFIVRMISCNIKNPPRQVRNLHPQIMEMINSTFANHGYQLMEDGLGPTIVTIVNASRTQADIQRDVFAANLTSREFL